MKTVEVTYRYGMPGELPRPRPADAESARRRLDEGNSAFAALFDLAEGSGTPRGLAEPPANASAFAELADLIVESDRIGSLLTRQPH